MKENTEILVENWRADELERAGVQQATARMLARTKEDLHIMLAAIERDCPEHILIEIFGPDPTMPRDPDTDYPKELDDPARQRDDPISKEG